MEQRRRHPGTDRPGDILDKRVRFHVLGEPFKPGPHLGGHNIPQNQGDPIDSPFAFESAIRQDGGAIVETAQDERFACLNRFRTRSFKTDALGRPV